MNLKKTAIAAAVATTLGVSTSASADIIDMTFTGKFTLMDASGVVQLNGDATGGADYGYRTAVSGSGSFDTATGSGSATIGAFSFFGGGLASASGISFQAIGNGIGGDGPLVAGQMGFNWNGTFGIPVTAVFDASGFFGSIQGPGSSWSVSSGATSATSDYVINSPFGNFTGILGAGPMVMTNYNTNGITLDDLFPLVDDGIAGSPMTTSPFPGFNAGFDFTTINATNNGTPAVPVPAAAWLFGSGLIGLVGVARRRRQS